MPGLKEGGSLAGQLSADDDLVLVLHHLLAFFLGLFLDPPLFRH